MQTLSIPIPPPAWGGHPYLVKWYCYTCQTGKFWIQIYQTSCFSPEWIDVRGNGVKSHTVQLCPLNQELEGNVRLRRSCPPWGNRKWQEYRPEDCEFSELRRGFLLHAWTCRSCCCTYWTRTCYFTSSCLFKLFSVTLHLWGLALYRTVEPDEISSVKNNPYVLV